MKKFISLILAMVLAMSFFTGCVKENGEDTNVEPTPTPTAAPVVDDKEEDEEDPNYVTVLAMWDDMNGYWVDEEGNYLLFKLNDAGKAEMHIFDKEHKLVKAVKATAVMASNKTSYYMAFEDGTGYFIELEGYGDNFVKIAKEEADKQEFKVYNHAGETLDDVKEAIKAIEDAKEDVKDSKKADDKK